MSERNIPETPPIRYSVAIHEMPSDERPRERLKNHGASALSIAELLAILLRTGTKEHSAIGLAELLLRDFKSLRGITAATLDQLCSIKGIGNVKAIEIAAMGELGKRISLETFREKPTIRGPRDVSNLLSPQLRDKTKEHFMAILLDTRNQVLKIVEVSIGTLDTSIAHPRDIFREAIISNASSIILAHNHPSGDPAPSKADLLVTQRLVEAGRLIGIDIADHVVLGDNRWVSFQERGLM